MATPASSTGAPAHARGMVPIPAPAKPRAAAPAVVASERLFAGAAEVLIEHRGMLYRLKQTALGKLILTK